MMQQLARVALVTLVAFACACGSALSQGKGEFKKGRYGEARQTLVSVETESRTWDDGRRTEYALYRGLTHGALGDRAAAAVWLQEAKALEAAHPGSLSADDLTRLNLALESLAVEPTGTAGP
jgi:hypothetical protein